MARRRVSEADGLAAVRAVVHGVDAAPTTPTPGGQQQGRQQLATATRYLLEELAAIAPGNALEVRVPPFGATQCLPGPKHTRGTPPGVVETDPATWVALATGSLSWAEALETGRVTASGVRADLAALLPLLRM